jgi:CelD/BcsL family acetyltransferase involved in cellulose biosynthesis
MFQSFAWNETAARVFGSREPVKLIIVENDSDAAIIPACRRNGSTGLIGERLFDYRDAISAEGAILAGGWSNIASLGSPFEITAVRGDSSVARWEGLAIEPFANAPAVLRGSISADEFLHAHNRLGRHSRRIRKHRVELRRHSGLNRELVRTIYEHKAGQGSPESNLFGDSLRRDFMVEICAHPKAGCDVFTYETAGDVVAALVTFRDGNWRRFYTIYYDHRWASLSPGQVLLYEITAQSLTEGLNCDFMTGEHPYKLRLATDVVPLHRVLASPAQLMQAARQRLAPAPLAA